MVLACRRKSRESQSRFQGALARTVRSCRLGSCALRTPLELDLSLRSLHAREEARSRILCFAIALVRSRDRMGKSVREGWKAESGFGLHRWSCAARFGV